MPWPCKSYLQNDTDGDAKRDHENRWQVLTLFAKCTKVGCTCQPRSRDHSQNGFRVQKCRYAITASASS